MNTPLASVLLVTQDSTLSSELSDLLGTVRFPIRLTTLSSVQDIRNHAADRLVIDLGSLPATDVAQLLEQCPVDDIPTSIIDVEHSPLREAQAVAGGATSYTTRSPKALADLRDELESLGEAHPYHVLFEAAGLGSFVLRGGVFEEVNAAFTQLVKEPVQALLGKCELTDIADKSSHDVINKVFEAAHRTRTPQNASIKLRNRNQEVELVCTASGHRQRAQIVGCVRSTNENAQLKQELDALRARTADMENMRALGEIAAGVAHDFNNALLTIVGRLERIRAAEGSASKNSDLDVALRAAKSASSIVNRLRDFTKRSLGDTWSSFALDELAHEAISFVETRMTGAVRMTADIQSGMTVRGNRVELGEVLVNLLSNAIDAVGDSGTIQLRCRQENDEPIIDVVDDGPGIPQQIQSRIFEPLFTTKGEHGTGMGLSVTQWVLRRHDIDLHLVTSDNGTTFSLRFRHHHTPKDDIGPLRKEHLLVLVVDDDVAVGEMLADLLADLGHRTHIIHSAKEAASVLEETSIDLMITDLDLPDLSGWQLARQSRSKHPLLRVGLISGWPLGASSEELHARGVDFVLEKPFSVDALARALTNLS